MKKGLLIGFICFVFAGVFACIYFINTANNLTDMKNLAKRYEADIQTELQTRFEKVPNLVKIVEQGTEHEQNIIDSITAAREEYNKAFTAGNTEEMLQASDALQVAITNFEENYPDIASMDLYKGFIDDYSGIEAAVNIARRNYNEVVMEYNNMVEHIPTSLIAKIKGLEPIEEFKASEEANKPVEIEFAD